MRMKSQLTVRFGRPVVAARRTPLGAEGSSTAAAAAAYALRRARAVALTDPVFPSAPPIGETAAIVAVDRATRAMLRLKPRGD
jgi:hypothetical protein